MNTNELKALMQSLFDRAVTGVKQQGRLSSRGDGCYYRDPANPAVRCAVGHLIPDAAYTPAMEGKLALLLVGSMGFGEQIIGPAFAQLDDEQRAQVIRMLGHLQDAHDDGAPSGARPPRTAHQTPEEQEQVQDFLFRASVVAEDFDLSPAVCEV